MSALSCALFAAVLASTPASAGPEPSRYPLAATVPVAPEEEEAVLRLPVPLDLRRQGEDRGGASDLVLLDAAGELEPVAVARGSREPERVSLPVWPVDRDTHLYEVRALDRPIDGLYVTLRGSTELADVVVTEERGGRWVPLGPPQQVWRHPLGDQTRVELPATTGPLRVQLQPRIDEWSARRADIDGFRDWDSHVDPVDLVLPVVSSVTEEDAWTRYLVELPGPLPVDAVTVHAEGDLFERAATVRAEPREPYSWMDSTATLHRVDIGGARVDFTRVPVPADFRGDRLYLYVQDEGDVPLEITELTLHLEGLELFLRAPGPGPLTLLGGAPGGTTPATDLGTALPELRRLASATLQPEPAVPNPAWQPPEDRAGLAGPGPEHDASGYRWRAPLTGGPGLVRIALTEEILARVDPRSADLRILTEDGRQVPYVLQRGARPADWGELAFTREEDGATSRLRVAIPHPDLRLHSLALETEAPVFSRRVTVHQERGAVLEPLRTFQWVGADRPLRVALDIDRVVGEHLVVEIDNGDDPPLPLSAVRGSGPAWELLTVLPAEPVFLYGGQPEGQPPTYDLGLLEDSLRERATGSAALGPVQELEPPPPSWLERIMVLAGVGVLLLGLLVLTVRLLRGVPEPEGDTDPAGEAAEAA